MNACNNDEGIKTFTPSSFTMHGISDTTHIFSIPLLLLYQVVILVYTEYIPPEVF